MRDARRAYRCIMDEIDTLLERFGYRTPAELADLIHDTVCAPYYDRHEQSIARLAVHLEELG